MDLSSFFNKRSNLINLLILLILVLAVPFSVNLVRQQQQLKSKATAPSIEVVTNGTTVLPGTPPKLKLDKDGKAIVSVKLTSPLGPPP